MNTIEQSEFLESIMRELDSDPDTTPQDKQLLKSAGEFLKPLLNPEPQVLYAGYDAGYYFIKIHKDVLGTTLTQLRALGYEIKFLEPPFGKPVMRKKR